MICNCALAQLRHLSLKCRIQVFIVTNIYIPISTQFCEHHLDNEGNLLTIL